MDRIIDFTDYKGRSKGIPLSKIYLVEPLIHSDGTNTVIEYKAANGNSYKMFLKETYKEVIEYINFGRWEKIK